MGLTRCGLKGHNWVMKLLFLCVANSARSQLAEGLAREIFGPDVEIESAGSSPSGTVQPWAVKVLAEQGLDISKNFSKSYTQLSPRFFAGLDYVITLCAEEICPTLPTKAKRLHWPIKDPAGAPEAEKQKAFQQARDLIREKLTQFKSEIM